VRLVLKAHAVAGPVIKNPETVGSIDLSQLHFHAVLRITIPGKDVEASAARSAQLLSNDLDLAQAQSSRISGEPVLQPYLVVTQVPQLCGLSGVHWKPWQIFRHDYHRSDLVYRCGCELYDAAGG
jgi:hypothetical protein